ncbi:hypothetical protein [Enterococcus gallinarum]|uniref:hypothetical protein n=1 Tax=Enterococcus gallinarum TaxID=1353 RepID=UPI00214ACC6A|nr:hypothetical protein [Enterococcus gallinarum]MCR1931652.1 hypothetical protein [Enterococcus gallinarum]
MSGFTAKEAAAYDRWKIQPPEEAVPITYDWQENPLYSGDICYQTEDGYVLEDEAKEYMDAMFMRKEIDL